MKRLALLALTAFLAILPGCGSQPAEEVLLPGTSEPSLEVTLAPTPEPMPTPKAVAEPQKVVGVVDNPLFFPEGTTGAEFRCYEIELGEYDGPVMLRVNEIAAFEYGKLYTLIFDKPEIPGDSPCFDWVDLDLGYFYVCPDRIYRIDTRSLKRMMDEGGALSEELFLADGDVVCQAESAEDSLYWYQVGRHQGIAVDGDIVYYGLYTNYVETSPYFNLTWQKGLGLVYYRSGRGAMANHVELNSPFYEVPYNDGISDEPLEPEYIFPNHFYSQSHDVSVLRNGDDRLEFGEYLFLWEQEGDNYNLYCAMADEPEKKCPLITSESAENHALYIYDGRLYCTVMRGGIYWESVLQGWNYRLYCDQSPGRITGMDGETGEVFIDTED